MAEFKGTMSTAYRLNTWLYKEQEKQTNQLARTRMSLTVRTDFLKVAAVTAIVVGIVAVAVWLSADTLRPIINSPEFLSFIED